MLGGFASGNVILKFRVINVQDSFEVESVSSLAPPPYYSSYKERASSLTSLCIGQTMNQPNENEESHNDNSRLAHYSCLYEETRPEARLPSPYSFEDVPVVTMTFHYMMDQFENEQRPMHLQLLPARFINSHDRPSRKVCNNSLGSGGTLDGVDSVGYDLVWRRGLKGLQVHRQF